MVGWFLLHIYMEVGNGETYVETIVIVGEGWCWFLEEKEYKY